MLFRSGGASLALSRSACTDTDPLAHSVNLGGLFVLEPFIVPSLYQTYTPAADEWTLSQLVSSSTTSNNNLTAVLADHYANFITEEDIAQIAGAGLNWIRLPIPFWAIETWADVGGGVAEPFLARVCWQYILRLLGWCRKYGIRVNLDLHTIPGSQNGASCAFFLGTGGAHAIGMGRQGTTTRARLARSTS